MHFGSLNCFLELADQPFVSKINKSQRKNVKPCTFTLILLQEEGGGEEEDMCNRDASFNHEKYLESNSKYKNLHIFIIIRNHSKDGVLVVINTSK